MLRQVRAQRRLAEERIKLKTLRAQSSALATYQAAEIGRRNRNWKANNASADLAIIPDSTMLIGRARQLDRDSWIGRSMVRSFRRNVVGRGIVITPHAKDPDGNPLKALNHAAHREFALWCRNKAAIDVEKRKTFSQFQRMAAKEKFRVGEHLWMWSYRPRYILGPTGPVLDRSKPVYLQLQAFEPEQFDLRILSYEGREVRGGIEVDENGAPVAYHIYTRNPNDVLYRHAFFSQRVPAERVFHYFEQDRVLQTRGVTDMAPIMQTVRRMEQYEDASTWRAVMEACIGLVIQSSAAGGAGYGPSPILPRGDMGSAGLVPTTGGVDKEDFAPGMVARTLPGEEVSPFVPTTAGNQYSSFTERQVRNVGAGVGQSFGQIARQYTGSYSAERQGLLDDRKEIEPDQDLIIDDLIRPTYELFFHMAAMEGRFDGVTGFDMGEYLADRTRFLEAEYIPPPQTWIDPLKEASAYVMLLENRLITREEIVALRGQRYYQTLTRLASEQDDADELHLPLPENKEDRRELRQLIQAMLGNRLGTLDNLAANTIKMDDLMQQGGVPVQDGYKQPVLPIVDQTLPKPTKGKPAPAAGATPTPLAVEPAMKSRQMSSMINPEQGGQGEIDGATSADFGIDTTPPPAVPDYRPALDPMIACASCSFAVGLRCSKFNFVFEPENVCGAWAAKTLTENIGVPNTAKTFPPGPQPGERPLEDRFYSAADPTMRP